MAVAAVWKWRRDLEGGSSRSGHGEQDWEGEEAPGGWRGAVSGGRRGTCRGVGTSLDSSQ